MIISIVLALIISEPAGPNVCHSSEVEPAFGISSAYFRSQPALAVSLLPAIHLSFLSLLWITGTVLGERCPNTFVLPKQSIAVSFARFRFARLTSSPSEVTRGPAGQLVLIASRGFFLFFWGPPSQPGCSDVRRAGYRPPGNVQAATHRGNRRTAQMRTTPSHSF